MRKITARKMIALLMTVTMILTMFPMDVFAQTVLGGSGTQSSPYLIASSEDWDALSASINSGSTEYAGKYFKLTNDISVTTMLGTRPGSSDSEDRPFIGTFDGAGHTLNVNINTSLGFAAPFAIAHNSTIKNLKVTGSVTTTNNHATGLVGASKGVKTSDESSLTIQNVTVSAFVSCNSHIAGVIGHAHQADITMENVVFNGSLNASSVQGGFIGWGGAIHGFNASFKDCLFEGTYKSGVAFHPIAFASGQGTVTLLSDFYTTKAPSGGNPITPTGSGSLKIIPGTRLISSASDWNEFADAVLAGETFENYLVKLTNDITVTRGIGSGIIESATAPVYPFSGTFDGCGHTLNFVPPADTEANYVAPFSIVKNATVTNLKVTGKVTAYNNISGLVGSLIGTLLIENVISDVDVSGNFVGGFIGHGSTGNITVRNSAYTGDLNGSTLAGGIICWRGPTAWDPSGVPAVHMENCLFAGRAIGTADFHPIGFTQQTNVPSGFTNMWSSVSPKNNSKGFYNYQYQGASYKPTVAVVTSKSDTSGTCPWMGYFDVTAFMPTEGALAEALNAWTGAEKLFLLGDATANTTATVPAGSHTLDLNGHTVKAASAGYSVITVGSGAELVIDDTAGGGKITGGSVGQNYGGGVTVDGGRLTLKGGAISGNVNIYSGIGNCGGGIHVKNSGQFYMEGGEISDNTSYVGGGICSDASDTTVSITGGVIRNNTTERFGSAVWAGRTNSATFRIGGNAEIVGNISKWTADKDGEATVNFTRLLLSGDPTIQGDWNANGTSSPNTHINFDNSGSGIQCIELDGELTNSTGTAKITISPIYRWSDLKNGQSFVFTKNWNQYMGTANPADYFKVDDSVSGVKIIRRNGEAAVAGSSVSGDLYITFDANGGTGEMDAQLVSSASAVLNQNLFTNGEKEFIGWNTKADGSGTPYSDKGDITLSGDVTLYAQWLEKHEHDDVTFIKWEQTSSLPTKAGDYYLGADVTISSTWNVPSGTVNLCLDGHGIKMVGSGSVINVGSSAVLNVYDCGETEHKFIVNSPASNGAGCAIVNDSLAGDYKTFTGGYITGGNAREGGGIKVNGTANLTLNGGTIIGNQSSFMGAGIKADNNGDNANVNITVNGGAILYNTVNGYGAGICSDGSITMTGGTIAYNYATKYPGGIHCHYLYLSGGSIVNNYADDNEYSAGVHADHEVFISGNPVISGNMFRNTTYNLDWDRTELAHGHKLNITGALTEGAQISVTLKVGGTGVFTNGWSEYMGDADPAKYFASDNPNYSVFLGQDGEAEIGVPPVASVISGETVTNYGTLADAIGAWTAGSTLKLLADVTTSSTVTAPSGEHTLALNGHTITRTDVSGYDNFGLVITLGDGANLTVIGPGKVTGGKGYHGGGIHVEGNSSLVLDNCEISGNAGQFGGGLYLRNGTITMKNGTVVKDNIALAGYGGSGIYAEGSGTLIMDGCTFTNNEIQNENQYAVFLCGNANMKVSGAPVINNNTYGSAQHDLYLYQTADQHSYVLMKDSLTDGAKIIVGQTIGTGVFTNGWSEYMGDADPADYFTSDNADYIVTLDDSGEAYLRYPDVANVSAKGYEGDYDGEAHGITVTAPEGASIKYGTEEGSYTLDASPAYTNAGSYTVYYQVSQAKRTSVSGSAVVKINKIDATVTITGHSATANYDGEEHGAEGFDVAIANPLYTEADFSFSGKAEAVRTNAGTTQMGLAAEQFTNTNANFGTVTFVVTDGSLTVNPIDVTVTVTGHTLQADYDGTAHSVDGYDVSFSTPLYTAEDFTFSGRAEAVRTNKGVTQMGLAPEQFENTNANFATVTFVVSDGYITIDPIDVIVTISGHNETADYDGKAHTISGYDVSFSNALYTEADFTFSGNATAEMTDAGTAKMGLAPNQFENTNENFATVAFVVNDGTLIIHPIDVTVTITGHNSTADYDGKAHSADGYDVAFANPLYTEADFSFSGNAAAERTDAGTTQMGLAPSQFANTNANFATVTFEVTDGFVTIEPIDVTVTITGHNSMADYDGKAHSADGYDVAFANPLYTEADFSFSGRAEAVRTNVGTTEMGLAPEQFENLNANFKEVTFDVTDGFQTVNPVDAVITSAPHAKDTLDYNGKAQSLFVAGVAEGGTLYYALGKDMDTVPANKAFSTSVPTAKEIGNYFIWYKVIGDSNHNSLAPVVFKVTLADPNWVTISGKILNNDKTPLSGADVILMSGNQVVDTITSYENGEYFFTVPAGVYNIVVESNGVTLTNIANVTGDVTSDIVLPAPNTESTLEIIDSDKSIAVGGLEAEANAIRVKEGIPDSTTVLVSMTVKAIASGDTSGSQKIGASYDSDKYLEFYDLKVEKTIDTTTTTIDKSLTVLEIVIPCSFTTKKDLAVYSCDGSDLQTLTLSDSKEPGTYRVDEENGLIFIYTNSFSTVALSYRPYFSVMSDVKLGSYTGNVSVKLVKDSTGETFEINNVTLQDISFTGVPKGIYTMTVTWTDLVENTLTLPFTVK